MKAISALVCILGLLIISGVYVLFFLESAPADQIIQLLYIMRSTGLVIIIGAALGMMCLALEFLFTKTISWLEKNDDDIH